MESPNTSTDARTNSHKQWIKYPHAGCTRIQKFSKPKKKHKANKQMNKTTTKKHTKEVTEKKWRSEEKMSNGELLTDNNIQIYIQCVIFVAKAHVRLHDVRVGNQYCTYLLDKDIFLWERTFEEIEILNIFIIMDYGAFVNCGTHRSVYRTHKNRRMME